MRSILLAVVLSMPYLVEAQQTIISGRVIDSQTLEPIPFAHIFIVNTSFGTTTNDDGNFRLASNNYGEADLVASFVGYETYRKHIVYSGESLDLGTIRLKTSETQLDEIVVKASRDNQWEKDLRKFKGIFLGKDAFASECTIDNPWVIDLQNDEASHTFSAKSIAPITITNRAMGYQLSFILKKMVSNADSYSIEGDSYFTPLKPSSQKEREKWETNRAMVYRHSLTNLLRSMVNHNINAEGFTLYSEMPGQGGTFTRMSRFGDNFGKQIQFADTTTFVTRQQGTDRFIISFKGRLEAHYRNERARIKIYQDVSYAVTWLTLRSNSVVVNSQGIPTNPTAVIVSGSMSDDRVARMLPLDYTPTGTDSKQRQQQIIATLPYLYEQIYVHTDKPYYYAGEQLWFKGYINYHAPSLRDSLSKTVYVDLITPEKKILLSKTLRIDSGRFSGELQIPVGMNGGTYNLRAYTNLQRNFGDSTLYVKPIPLLELKDMVEQVHTGQLTQDGITVTTSNNTYKPREKIEVEIKLTDEEGQPMYGDLSMSVTDMKQVSAVQPSQNILDRYPIKQVPPVNPATTKTPFVVEYGITLKGQFLNATGKPEKAQINVVQLQPKDLALSESDENGHFVVNHLMIYDSARFSITASDKKGKSYGKAVLLGNDKAPVVYKNLKDDLKIVPAVAGPRDIRSGNDAQMLMEVEIRRKKTPDEYTSDYRVRRPYGKPNFVLDVKDLHGNVYPNVLMMIQGRFPGLVVRQALNPGADATWKVYLARNERGSINYVKEVIVTVNDVFVGGTPEQTLMMLNPATVQTIELKTSVSVLYGTVSNQGILAIYTKDGSDIPNTTKTIGTVKATGYNFSPAFSGPDYETESPTRPDYRSLIYWNPIVPISGNGTAKVSFFAADLRTTYRIEIEGVNSDGKPVRLVKTIEVAE